MKSSGEPGNEDIKADRVGGGAGRRGGGTGSVRQPVACALIFFFPLVAAAPSQLRMTVWRAGKQSVRLHWKQGCLLVGVESQAPVGTQVQ